MFVHRSLFAAAVFFRILVDVHLAIHSEIFLNCGCTTIEATAMSICFLYYNILISCVTSAQLFHHTWWCLFCSQQLTTTSFYLDIGVLLDCLIGTVYH